MSTRLEMKNSNNRLTEQLDEFWTTEDLCLDSAGKNCTYSPNTTSEATWDQWTVVDNCAWPASWLPAAGPRPPTHRHIIIIIIIISNSNQSQPQTPTFRVATTVYQCLHGMVPAYLAELCLPITASASRRGGLPSATTSNLVKPRCRLSTPCF